MKKKEKDLIYWKMDYKGKFKRTLLFIPIVLVLCFLTPLFMGQSWLFYDILMIIVLIWQLIYNYKKMKKEDSQKQ